MGWGTSKAVSPDSKVAKVAGTAMLSKKQKIPNRRSKPTRLSVWENYEVAKL